MRPPISLVAAGALILAAACDAPRLAPTEAPRAAFSPPSSQLLQVRDSYSSYGLWAQEFVLSPGGGSVRLGLYTLDYPARAVCDPETSSYGDTHWDDDCKVADRAVKVRAVYGFQNGNLVVDFTPSLRFAPSDDPARWVTLSTDVFAPVLVLGANYFAAKPATLAPLTILYAPSLGADAEKDAVVDASLRTRVDLRTGRIWRRVKHFSGYLISTGEACEPSPDNPDCVEGDPPLIVGR